ncbi:Rieske domain-containing -like [Chlorella sorokiniana]|uniref:Rieske domain-containing-like n=1 Tax=Chlorella sorokiniana TaxID=3076 RepID=A0A2P6TWS2_CHLSO|nr:Rieske domain-containing -like [Chlorella sorokiniana]|eukprot:PRW58512.1 Rieske domain-containing -like [Chlorella sorokiniana]
MGSSEPEPGPAWHFVGKFEESTTGDRLHGVLGGRYISVIRHEGSLFAIDSVCFHAGGPLGLGDIEDVNGHTCVVCPWHYYVVALDNGEKWYQGTVQGPDGKLLPGAWKSVGQRQRTHHVQQREDGGIWVQLNLEGQLASDEYAYKPECGLRIQTGHLRLSPQHLHASDGSRSPRMGSPRREASPSRRGSSPRSSPPASPRFSGEGEDCWPADLPEPPMHSRSMRLSNGLSDSFKRDSFRQGSGGGNGGGSGSGNSGDGGSSNPMQ